MAKSLGSAAHLQISAAGNLLTDDQRTMEGTGTSGWAVYNGATVAVSTDVAYAGAKSLKVTTTAGLSRGARTSFPSCDAGAQYIGSVYVYPTSTQGVRLQILDDDSGFINYTFIPPAANVWYRLILTHTTNAAATTIWMRVVDEADGDAQTFYLDEAHLRRLYNITEILSVTLSQSVTAVDATDWDSGERKEYLEGDFTGTLSFECANRGLEQAMENRFYDKLRSEFVYYPQGNVAGKQSLYFFGYVNGVGMPSTHEGFLTRTYDVQIDSEVTVQTVS